MSSQAPPPLTWTAFELISRKRRKRKAVFGRVSGGEREDSLSVVKSEHRGFRKQTIESHVQLTWLLGNDGGCAWKPR